MLVERDDRLAQLFGKGLTRHENWWPALYSEWCRLHGKTPEPAVLAYHETYETARADLQAISASA